MALHSPQHRQLRNLLAGQSVNVRGASPVTATKARTMLRDGSIRGKPLTSKQRGLFGLIASGKQPRRS